MKTSTIHSKFAYLYKKLPFKIKDENLLKTAFVHRSFLNENKNYKGSSNERLEFLGDAVLSIIVSKFLYEKLPKSSEGHLTQIRASLVRTETLAKIGATLGLSKYLFLSKGEEDSGGRTNQSILANVFEALVGAIYLDQNLANTQKFIENVMLKKWQILAKTAIYDHKSKIQEMLQRKHHQSPIYKLLSTWGPDHARQFEIGIYLADQLLGRGTGKNKQEAAQNAARSAITRLRKIILR